MAHVTRRAAMLGAGAGLLSACGAPVGSNRGAEIDRRVDAAIEAMYAEVPETRDLAARASGVLVIPLMTRGALFTFGGGYGEGALRIGGATVDYYSAANASFGLQFGIKQYAHALFFMTPEALGEFRASEGFEVGADLEYIIRREGELFRRTSTEAVRKVVAVVFGEAGLMIGVKLDGTKYTRVLR